MISVEEALKYIRQHSKKIGDETISTAKALNFVLAEDIFSPLDMPAFDQSAMDGYAVAFSSPQKQFNLVGEIAAGENNKLKLSNGQACRIFTGAAVPEGANAVIKQEDVTKKKNQILTQHTVAENENIRPAAEQIKKGEKALTKNTLITPAAIGFLYSMGIENIKVHKKPKIQIIATGNEIVQPGKPLERGQIYDSNTYMLAAALKQYHYVDFEIVRIKDDYQATENAIKTALDKADFLILSGGISVGDYDFVRTALLACDVKEIFYKIKQKPGKPLFFGKKAHKMIFALPGNPASALSCFYVYALNSLDHVAGKLHPGLQRSKKKLTRAYRKKAGKVHFLKAFATEDTVEILEGQSSAMLHTFAVANALAYLPEEVTEIKKNEEVEVYLF